jgi:rhodanese-related sulfurtransferase
MVLVNGKQVPAYENLVLGYENKVLAAENKIVERKKQVLAAENQIMEREKRVLAEKNEVPSGAHTILPSGRKCGNCGEKVRLDGATIGYKGCLAWPRRHCTRNMKRFAAACFIVLSFALPCHAQKAAAPAAPSAKAEATDVTPDQAEKLMAETPGIIVLDVRTPEEFERGHIKGAVNLNIFDNGFQQQVAALDQTKPVIVHCQSGGRSSQAVADLAGKVKFPKVYHLRSGFKGWKDAKKPIEEKSSAGSGGVDPGKKAAPAAPK